ncbi:fluoride efflux transporter CrcB [Aneurinibacillus migulanus]|nr:fluoride efflux transporter CrcB [Aneurinibacillus migulanus]MCP1358662.1 fluoride efflux transporter CrcB [Aneurinibacillus migulanus]MED0895230.1 fluoride efflux transporter CrcB [Aneurinibacillus migulanus]MED1619450.1 fluoride efflux transporter CrcB [Aneurinibacillus migulanus]SDJ57481.1 CrcB protein [Aneurinibacillus migulanus]GED14152.1 putative fluoride ion transporter CrcB [Aneurinibacillus migulanus]
MVYLFIGLGGILGAVLRYGIGTWSGIQTETGFPLPTLLINLAGCFILAFFYTITTTRFTVHPHFRTSFGTGFVGSFTTFSTFGYETLELLQSGRYGLAAIYIALSLIGGYILAYAGIVLGSYERGQFTRVGRKQ